VSTPARPLKARAAGDRAVLIELVSNAEVHRFAAAVRTELDGRLEDVVPGHQTVLISSADGPPPLDQLQRILAGLSGEDPAASELAQVRIPVVYDGPDLHQVAVLTGLSVEAVCNLHSSAGYTAAFMGFAPGFAYLLGTDPRLQIPRRQTPRVKVRGGSVAIAGEYSAVYPSEGPGGWHIIGHTDAVLFDASLADPCLLRPGTPVSFEPPR
jgi:KipI family sensor histidine kinase inhibitor